MGKILSVIIPAYNMEDYLETCLTSLLIDGIDKIEVLVINDGSTDGTSTIAHRFANNHPDTFKVVDKTNGNYGSCINVGLHEATGKYVKVLDADDSFITRNFESMVNALENLDVDLLVSDFIKDHIGGKSVSASYSFTSGKVLDFNDVCRNEDFRTLWMHTVTYKRENLLRIGYHQTEGISYTDQEWIFFPMTTVQTLYYFDRAVYDYVLGREGQTMDGDVYRKHFGDNIICTCDMLDGMAAMHGISDDMRDVLNRKLYGRIRLIYKYCLVRCKDFDTRALMLLDNKIRETSESLYKQSGGIPLSRPLFPFKYIKMWRHNKNSKRLRIIISAYRAMKRL